MDKQKNLTEPTVKVMFGTVVVDLPVSHLKDYDCLGRTYDTLAFQVKKLELQFSDNTKFSYSDDKA